MTPSRWTTAVREALEAALRLPTGWRATRRFPATIPRPAISELRAEVEALLACEAEAGSGAGRECNGSSIWRRNLAMCAEATSAPIALCGRRGGVAWALSMKPSAVMASSPSALRSSFCPAVSRPADYDWGALS